MRAAYGRPMVRLPYLRVSCTAALRYRRPFGANLLRNRPFRDRGEYMNSHGETGTLGFEPRSEAPKASSLIHASRRARGSNPPRVISRFGP